MQESIKKILGSGTSGSGTKTLIISNKEIDDVMKRIKYLEESGLLLKSVTKVTENEAKPERRQLLSMLLGTLSASLVGKGVI